MGKLVERPWGSFELLLECENYVVKRLVVHPGSMLSLQSHSHRNEHWVVVEGEGIVTLGEEKLPRRRNEHVYIPMGTKHRVANLADSTGLDLVLIEVQTGDLLSEDDIVRYEDIYGRK
ncbi:MAG: phosphomannose isomerase type II C-terminal cupin domain [Rickettsiales bacterium]|jgi:mannose-6-phosphate isomerase-like protein (cupin superfamily)|nr:phosphomannose isomerase type II C-terminal cupin domain [Rickettsiales bacterium]